MTNPDTHAVIPHDHWRVSVETSGEHIVSIEPEMLAGREPSDADTIAIRTAAHHLLAFIGEPAASGWEREEKLTVEQAWTILCETPDITSPAEYPDHALITMEQLASFMARAMPTPAPQLRVYPHELTDDLRDILSMMMWVTGPIAHALRDGGQDIKRKAEDEQAEVLHWLICLALEHGSEWRSKASDRIREIRAAFATTEGSDNG